MLEKRGWNGHQMEQNLAAIFADGPGGDHGLTRLTGAQPLGNSIDIEVDDPILGQIALDKSLVLRPQPFGDLAHRRAREQPTPAFVRKRVLDVTGRQPARIKLDCQILESLCLTRQILSDLRDERSGVSRTCGAENSTVPSAVFIRPGLYPFR